MAQRVRPHDRDDFEIAIICALPIERDAVEVLLEAEYETDGFSYGKAARDPNAYTTGRLGNQDVVLAYMPGMGTISAAAVAANLRISFKRIKLGIVVGICGGVPKTSDGEEIVLGDVIISTSVIQVDFGAQYPNTFIRKQEVEDTLGRANPEVRAFLGKISGHLVRKRLQAETSLFSAEICAEEGFSKSAYPGPSKDLLYPAEYRHKHWISACTICAKCQDQHHDVCNEALKSFCENLGCKGVPSTQRIRIQRAMGVALTPSEMEEAQKPCIHFGRIACSNHVIKSGQHRDRVAADEKVIGFEMESGGTWDYVPTIVIKSVCDYADSHKNKQWQRYAAATAAACTKAVLGRWRKEDRPVQRAAVQELPDPCLNSYPVHWIVARSPNTLFTGREDILRELETTVLGAVADPLRQDRCSIVVFGMGGQGKSEICLQLAHRVRKSFWGIFWIDVSTTSSAENGFLYIARRLKWTVQIWEDARLCLANLKQPWLLVLDNADDPEVDYQPYFPAGPSGVVILTSRNEECEQHATTKQVDLRGLSDDEARELLLKAARLPQDQHETLQDDAQAVASLLRSHALALIQAGAYVSGGHCTLKEYPKVYEDQRQRLLGFRPSQAKSRYGDVYATFEASAEILQSSNNASAIDALQLLKVLASCGPSRFPLLLLFEAAWKGAREISPVEVPPVNLLTLTPWHVSHLPRLYHVPTGHDRWDSFQVVEAINLLKAFSLVSTDTHDGFLCISMHPLVHAWSRDRLGPETQHESWVTTGCLVALSCSNNLLWRKQARHLQPHLQALVSSEMNTIFGSEPVILIIRILMKCGWQLREMRADAALFVLIDHMFTHLNLHRSTVAPQWLGMYELSAQSLLDRGKPNDAVQLLEEVIKIQKQTLAEDHPDRLASQHNLAMAYKENGQIKEAVPLLEQVVEIQKQTLAEDHPDRLSLQYSLAMVYQENGQIKEAVPLLEQVVEIRKQTLAEDHPDRLASQHCLAMAYKENGQIKEAVSLLEQVVEIQKQTLAEDHPYRLSSQYRLAMAFQANSQIKEAVPLLEQVVETRKQTLAEDHPNRLSSQYSLAMAYKANGQIKEAQVVEIQKQTLAEDNPNRLASQHCLALAYQANEQIKEAVPLLEQVVEIQKQTLAEDDPRRLASQHNLAGAYQENGQIKEAVPLLEQVVEIRKQTLAEDHPDRLASQHNLAGAYQANGQIKEAVPLLEQVVEIEKQTLAEDHPDRLVSQHTLATSYWKIGRHDTAMQMMQRVVEIRRRVLDDHHPHRKDSEKWLENMETEMARLDRQWTPKRIKRGG
ncbi:hypothetical protein A1O3_07232 [Capronia epimyces CBS 606.96]|uniref:Uncharacterized protein n=1 Tax=Capronia epimyces CBS 606.96 TaxID=1182542 RepID=W9YF76_9EURO|nr:uncharacterized protein A1O3_07232 [Capronia epimyces CBS 606.96]EXJ80944.1 hypothetical protein A1O3_07232 [Capronia epimyces CBS 606.96]